MTISPVFLIYIHGHPPAVFIVPNNPPLPWSLIEQRLLTKQIKLKVEYSKNLLIGSSLKV